MRERNFSSCCLIIFCAYMVDLKGASVVTTSETFHLQPRAVRPRRERPRCRRCAAEQRDEIEKRLGACLLAGGLLTQL